MNGSSRQGHYNAHELLKNGVTDFTNIASTNSGHYIIYEEPGLIIDNIKLLISKLPQKQSISDGLVNYLR
jgi:hypothetical protein